MICKFRKFSIDKFKFRKQTNRVERIFYYRQAIGQLRYLYREQRDAAGTAGRSRRTGSRRKEPCNRVHPRQ